MADEIELEPNEFDRAYAARQKREREMNKANGHDRDESYVPPGELGKLPPPPDRASLVLSAWLDRDIPPRDYLLGSALCTTSRWFVIGETGIGKTLFGGAMSGAIAKGASFLMGWTAPAPRHRSAITWSSVNAKLRGAVL